MYENPAIQWLGGTSVATVEDFRSVRIAMLGLKMPNPYRTAQHGTCVNRYVVNRAVLDLSLSIGRPQHSAVHGTHALR